MNEDKLTPLQEIGKQFQEARLHRGVIIEDVAKNLKISAKILRAIEDGDREALPQLVFLRGFVKSYGESLGFSQSDLQKTLLFLEDSEPKSDLTPRAPEKSTFMSDTPYVSKQVQRKRTIITVIVALLVLVFAYVMYSYLFTPIDKEEVVITTKIEDNTQAKKIAESALEAVKNAGAELQLDKAKEMQVAREEEELEALTAQIASDLAKENNNGEAVVFPELSEERPVAEIKEEEEVPAFIDDAELQKLKEEADAPEYERVSSFGTGRRTLLITASHECWISFELDYREPREVYLAPGEEVFVRFETQANLRVGNAGGVNVTYNGQDLGAPGRLGQVKRLSYPFKQSTN